jgi:hypothetical protein
MKESTFNAEAFKTLKQQDSKYLDQFREKNFSSMRHTFSNFQKPIDSVKWEIGLRNWANTL